MIVCDPSVSTIPYVIFCQQVLNIDLPFGSICRSSFGAAPPPGQLEASVRIRQTSNRSLQILLRDVAPTILCFPRSRHSPCTQKLRRIGDQRKNALCKSRSSTATFAGWTLPALWGPRSQPSSLDGGEVAKLS